MRESKPALAVGEDASHCGCEHEYDFDRILSHRFRLDQVTDAFHGMQSMREIKPVVIPEFA